MKAKGLLVPRERGEEVRRTLRNDRWLRTDLAIRREGKFLALPLADQAAPPLELGEVVEREFTPLSGSGPTDYRELLDLPKEQLARLPRSFDVIGDVVLVRVPEDMAEKATEIGLALLSFVPGARIVGADGGVHGPERRRSLRLLAGGGGWGTRYRENGIDIEVDLEQAYFSPRLAREHARVADAVARGDRVYDLCCGVGPFSLTIARDGRAARVAAVDSNPSALALLRSSLAHHSFRVPVETIDLPVEEFTPSAEPVERVILNLPLEGIKYLPSVARTVAPRGHLYYYEVVPRDEIQHRGEAVVRALGSSEEWAVAAQHVVHPYSPAADLIGYDLERREPRGGVP